MALLILRRSNSQEERDKRITKHLPKLRSARACEAIIRRDLLPVLGNRPVAAIRRREVVALVEAIQAREAGAAGRPKAGGTYAASHALAQLSKLFNWAIVREYVEVNPCKLPANDVLPPPAAQRRVLTDDELRAIWKAAGEMGQPFGTLYRLLILTGQRVSEVANAAYERARRIADEAWPDRKKRGNARTAAEVVAMLFYRGPLPLSEQKRERLIEQVLEEVQHPGRQHAKRTRR